MLQLIESNIRDNPKPVEFIGGLFPKSHVSIVASRPGVGKTWFMCWFMQQISNGGEIFFDRELDAPPRTIVYFSGEAGDIMIAERFANLEGKINFDRIKVYSLTNMLRQGFLPFLEIEDNARMIATAISKFRPSAVIFDSLMAFRQGDENSARDTTLMMSNTRRIAEALDTAVICTHHLRKRDQKSIRQEIDQDEIIGSSALVRTASTAYILFGQSGKTLRCVKTWWEQPSPLSYKMLTNSQGLMTFQPFISTDNETERRVRIQDILMRNAGREIDIDYIAQKYSVSKSTVYNALTVLKARKVKKGIYIIDDNTLDFNQ